VKLKCQFRLHLDSDEKAGGESFRITPGLNGVISHCRVVVLFLDERSRRVSSAGGRPFHVTQVNADLLRVPLDENEGVVKRHLFAAMLCSTAWISEWWRTEALKVSR
jgi:hypothetical protein